MSSYKRYNDFFTWWVPLSSRRFQSWFIFMYTLITTASFEFLWLIRWFFYMRGSCGFSYILKFINFMYTLITTALYDFIWPIRWFSYIWGFRGFTLDYFTNKHTYNLFYLWKNAMLWEDAFEMLLESERTLS